MNRKDMVDIELPAAMVEELRKYGDPTEQLIIAVTAALKKYKQTLRYFSQA